LVVTEKCDHHDVSIATKCSGKFDVKTLEITSTNLRKGANDCHDKRLRTTFPIAPDKRPQRVREAFLLRLLSFL